MQLVLDTTARPRAVESLEMNRKPVSVSGKKDKKTPRQKQYKRNLGTNGVTLLDVIHEIISEKGRPMFPIEIATAFESDYPEMMFVSKKPRCSINANISKDIALNGKDSRFVKTDRRIGLN